MLSYSFQRELIAVAIKPDPEGPEVDGSPGSQESPSATHGVVAVDANTSFDNAHNSVQASLISSSSVAACSNLDGTAMEPEREVCLMNLLLPQ